MRGKQGEMRKKTQKDADGLEKTEEDKRRPKKTKKGEEDDKKINQE